MKLRLNRPLVLLLDMDGPLADFDRHFHDRCVEMGGIEFDVAGPHEQTERYFTEHIPDPRQRREARKMIDAAGWFAQLPVVEGAKEGVAELEAAGIDIWVCTKPLERNPTCRDDKGAWLRRHFPQLEDKLILAPNKGMIHGDILLDDAPKVEWFDYATWRPVLFAVPFNSSPEWATLPRWTWGDSIDDLFHGAFR